MVKARESFISEALTDPLKESKASTIFLIITYLSYPSYYQKKNDTPIHIGVPSQHKHKIKHDKTTTQSGRSCRGGTATLNTYSHIH
ncbi:hypothetical protein FNJ59_07120 [Bacteroides pyogenes]|uniref:Uncharacterized protein n=1 Tax=Bacteroides pyogenes TaxID=310300 RepID=A0A5D3EVT3_9BACE|nr:hypothetical protein FNJ60_05965 [Bacteroides pyogenes]TYK39550.1 hypothetical protein FNJ59_07120 [Bacteroides pyogenes]TYK47616.1 hypothetical protein FNG97_08375 [Bacteroides pyogenes]